MFTDFQRKMFTKIFFFYVLSSFKKSYGYLAENCGGGAREGSIQWNFGQRRVKFVNFRGSRPSKMDFFFGFIASTAVMQVSFRTVGGEFRSPKLKLLGVIFILVDCFICFLILFWAMTAEYFEMYLISICMLLMDLAYKWSILRD